MVQDIAPLRRTVQAMPRGATAATVYLNVQEVAERLGVHYTTALSMLTRGDLFAIRIGRRWRVPVEALDCYLRGEKYDPNATDPSVLARREIVNGLERERNRAELDALLAQVNAATRADDAPTAPPAKRTWPTKKAPAVAAGGKLPKGWANAVDVDERDPDAQYGGSVTSRDPDRDDWE